MLITFGRLMIYRAKQEHFVGVSMVYVMLGKAPQNCPSRGPFWREPEAREHFSFLFLKPHAQIWALGTLEKLSCDMLRGQQRMLHYFSLCGFQDCVFLE